MPRSLAGTAGAGRLWRISQPIPQSPVVKISAADLPQRPNFHWIGQQTYEQLPTWVAGWDLSLVPFAINEATRFISPTKTLEYMAAGKPVVSTPIKDVVRLYGEVLAVGHDHDAFVRACRRALEESALERRLRASRMQQMVRLATWDNAARTVHQLLRAAARRDDATLDPGAATLARTDSAAVAAMHSRATAKAASG